MMAAALPLIDLVYRRGRFLFADTQASAIYFFWFSLSLALWSAQGLYARAFYAAGDTLTPMTAVTVITVASLPVYSFLFHTFGVVGLAWASDIGIGANLLALAWLLHYRKLVRLGDLRWGELGKAGLIAVLAGGISFEVAKIVPLASSTYGSRTADLMQLALVSITWAAATAAGLWLLRSELPGDLRRRKGTVYPMVAQGGSKEILGAGREP
jgi:putative peptidoglycan lipid II flippase